MRTVPLLLWASFWGLNLSAQTSKCPDRSKVNRKFIDLEECQHIDYSKPLRPNHRCRTTKGGTFMRVKGAWRNTDPNGLAWDDTVKNRLNYNQAKAYCKNIGKRLPSAAEMQEAEDRGLREVLAHSTFYFYWSGTAVPSQKTAYGFASSSESMATLPQSTGSGIHYIATRCVSP